MQNATPHELNLVYLAQNKLPAKQFADINECLLANMFIFRQYYYSAQSGVVLLVRLILFFFNNNSILYCEQATNGSDNEMLSPVAHGNNSNISDTLTLICRKEF